MNGIFREWFYYNLRVTVVAPIIRPHLDAQKEVPSIDTLSEESS